MNISILGPAYPYRGGIALHTNLLYTHLTKRHKVRLFNFSRMYPDILFPGKTQYDNSNKFDYIPSERIIDTLNPLTWYKTAQQIYNSNIDLLVIQFWHPYFAIAWGTIIRYIKSRSTSIKVISLCHNIVPHEGSPFDKVLTKYLFNKIDGFIIQSKSVINDLKRLEPNKPYKYNPHPIYNNFGEPLNKSQARQKLNLPQKKPLLLYFGYIRTYKGVEYLIRSFDKIHEEIGAELLIIGEFYDDKYKYLKEIEKTGVKDSITVIDKYIPNKKVNLYFSAADLLVLPYISATQSGITQIALSYELPCIVTDVGGLPEVVRDGQTGFVVEPRSSEDIANAAIKYFESTDKSKMEENIEAEKEQYSWDRMVSSLTQLYNTLQ